ncbi:cysteine--tRNA ligase [Candidatus Cardinium hertigii]|uniref:Cysteine--tRNA ligase n=1 Tax=Candidatus Cardinium hertigii TaxID=247481 RepID=A0A2Z3LF49_9BACT|nr:cysteine--tRNA ligase [Candidatus Cardinium hertigii]AWN82306.1 Cysteine--tRNA ligase [Candidatus Cardinium hertigii]
MKQPLKIYNSLTKQKALFKPVTPPFVGMYVCGPTVYGHAHLGHARTAITFDILFRYLQHLRYRVRYVRNITDVGHLERDLDEGNDKVQQQAKVEAVSPMEIAQRYTNSYRTNMEQLNVLPPSIEPCASGHIPEQMGLIQTILQHKLAYVTEGSVYFDVNQYNQLQSYGKLSGRTIEAMRSGTRALAGQHEKRNPVDFALWKKATPTHIMQWETPWGIGFPGWHIECTAIAAKYLGVQFDIHGGGIDLLFPHHECEIAQAQAAYKTDLATYWMHSNLITIHGTKMGKSLGNTISLPELFTGRHSSLDQPYSPMTLRFFMLQSHYRGVLSVSLDGLKAAYQGYRKLMNGWHLLAGLQHDTAIAVEDNALDRDIYAACADCYNAMNDDLNTAKALAGLFNLLKIINGLHNGQLSLSAISTTALTQLRTTYAVFTTDILGLREEHPAILPAVLGIIQSLYQEAKVAKRYHQVDSIRSALQQIGIAMQDHPNGTYWMYQ